FLHKLRYRLSRNYSIIAVENLNIRHMVKNKRLSKSISDAGWGMFRNMLSYKCVREGGLLIKVEPAFTTQDCSTCGTGVKKSLSIRTHICKKCGIILDCDHNACLNILQRGLARLDQHLASVLEHNNCRARLCPNSIITACEDSVRRNGITIMRQSKRQEAPASNNPKGC